MLVSLLQALTQIQEQTLGFAVKLIAISIGAKKIFCLKSLACYTVFGYVVIAVGVRYRPDEAPLPKVVCAGEDAVAKEIREAAVREGVPLMENVELARALYARSRSRTSSPSSWSSPLRRS